MFDLIRTINERMSIYEAEWGEIRAPRGPRGNGKEPMKAKAPTIVNRREVRTRPATGLSYSRVSRTGRSYIPTPPRKK